MLLVNPSYEIQTKIYRDQILCHLEKTGRICYKSENKITAGSASKFVKMIVKRGHEAMIEHFSITVKFICDRGVTHELVRHRLASFAQESTRYCNYKGGVMFVRPNWFKGFPLGKYEPFLNNNRMIPAEVSWMYHMLDCENVYKKLLKDGWSPGQARSVLPNALKTEIVVTANLREWKYIFKMRCAKDAHPQIQEIMQPLQKELQSILPEIYGGDSKC